MPPFAAWKKVFKEIKHGACIEAITHENEKSPTLISTCLGNAPCEHRELTRGPGFTSFHQSAENCHIHSVPLKLDGRAINHQQCSSTSCFSFSLCPVMRALMWKATSYVLVMKYIGAQDCVCTFLGCGFFSRTNTALETIATHHPEWCQSVSASKTNAFLGTPLKWKRQFILPFVKVLLIMKYWVSITS